MSDACEHGHAIYLSSRCPQCPPRGVSPTCPKCGGPTWVECVRRCKQDIAERLIATPRGETRPASDDEVATARRAYEQGRADERREAARRAPLKDVTHGVIMWARYWRETPNARHTEALRNAVDRYEAALSVRENMPKATTTTKLGPLTAGHLAMGTELHDHTVDAPRPSAPTPVLGECERCDDHHWCFPHEAVPSKRAAEEQALVASVDPQDGPGAETCTACGAVWRKPRPSEAAARCAREDAEDRAAIEAGKADLEPTVPLDVLRLLRDQRRWACYHVPRCASSGAHDQIQYERAQRRESPSLVPPAPEFDGTERASVPWESIRDATMSAVTEATPTRDPNSAANCSELPKGSPTGSADK